MLKSTWQSLKSTWKVYGALAAMEPKLFLAYRIWVWMEFIVQIVAMTTFVYFWRAVYQNTSTLSGLSLTQTLNYVLLAQILAPVIGTRLIFAMGYGMREGMIGIELLRPVDFQARYYVEALTDVVVASITKVPLVLLAVLLFGLHLPADMLTWGAFAVSLFLGFTVIFFFDWILACLAFYTTEVWGWSVLRYGFGLFFSGALVPLDMMPDWLRTLTSALPFVQSLYVPVSLLSGITPVSEAPRLWLVQLVWLVCMALASRLVFRRAVRAVTVQGG
ncbi:ABC transporter permease [Candidatus Amarolinea aalborgensis]|jgi:ABC-2 type transport system permease protein|uniref:ABC transporter permease n=1 Tax=Candidatus Amarolinea aalborgensis TaxID=2249329 RepID=UPI003BF9A14B